ncbi:hypothetical protein HYT45_04075 [Candidatus Uhrbacteria bacterium]|nr:hypothetical protein [Candidatus Wildermuthbacteria bacterium]MBI2099551.1 hypothetical protein [Candidatus Uhrbacteria bacterium]
MKQLKKIFKLSISLAGLIAPSLTLAQNGAEGGFGLEETARSARLPGAGGQTSLATLVGTIISYAMGIIGTILLVLILYGGFLWMTAAGNEDQVTKAKDIIKNSVIGLIIIVLAYGIAQFVVRALTQAAA